MTETATAVSGHDAPVARRAQARRAPGRPERPAGRSDAWRKRLEIALFITPALVLIALFIAWPVFYAVRFSVYKWKGFGPLADFVGLDNYRLVLQDPDFLHAVGHNFTIVAGSIIVQLPLGLGIALLLNRKMWGQGILRTIIFVPYVLAEVVAGVVWYQLLQPQYGMVDAILGKVGLTPPEQGWLGTPEYALWTVLAVLTWKYLGLAVILFLAGLQSVPEELYESAQLDGASWWQVQRKITIPLLGPTIRTWCFLSMIGSLQLFDMVWILTGGGPAGATTTMATYLINQGTKSHNYGIAGAASVILFVIAFVMAILYQIFILRRDTQDESRKARKKVKA
ncbi:raffinose/stachyose/melibiose transport system permease protein [Nocardioides terrae]|uniref:Raffinose/stachyose/melibiose transport system permease protein n=1 Tax=Nocardioides terrae TaxID=574651 RepID=A0A1I1L1C6_9ACTN|nr:sugar ABC transporter permease [Nocardioides terrae]SFC66856.1 raffinose/stachyose/melibiose transport system permease protein [Nocardioides terrae]